MNPKARFFLYLSLIFLHQANTMVIGTSELSFNSKTLMFLRTFTTVYCKDKYELRFGRFYENVIRIFKVQKQCLGHAVAQLLGPLRYKQEGSGFDFQWRHLKLSLTSSFRRHYVPRIDSNSKRNEYLEYLLGVKTAGALY
jgi:hypothetical protein